MGLANSIEQFFGGLVETTDRGVPAFVKDSSGNYAVMKLDSSGNLLSSIAGGGVASGATDSGNPVKVGGVYNSTPVTLTNSQRGDLQMDANGNVKVTEQWMPTAEDNPNAVIGTADKPVSSSTYAPTNVDSTAYAASLVIKNSPGVLHKLIGYNSKGSAQFIQLHDAISLPADTAVPKMVITAAATSNFEIPLSKYGRYFATGIVVCNSSTGPTKTVGSADCWFDAQCA